MATYAAIAAVIAVIGTAISTYAQVQSAQSQAKEARKRTEIAAQLAQEEADAQAKIDNTIADRKDEEAHIVTESAAFEERQSRRRVQLLLGKQRAIFAASGFDISTGIPLIQDIDLTQQGELEALSIRRAGAISASDRAFEANLARMRAESGKLIGSNRAEFLRFQGRQQASMFESSIPLTIASGAASAAASGFSAYTTTKYVQRPTRSSALYDMAL